MPNFRILTDKTMFGSAGDVVASENFPDYNFELLAEAGHAEAVVSSRKADKKEQD